MENHVKGENVRPDSTRRPNCIRTGRNDRKKLTENTQGHTSLVQQIAAARQSDVESSAGHLQAVVEVRRGEVHDRRHSFGVRGFLRVTDGRRPHHSRR